jgi:hypothetical protein
MFNRTCLKYYLISVIKMVKRIRFVQTNRIHHKMISSIPLHIFLQKCQNNLNIDTICKKGNVELLKWYQTSYPEKQLDRRVKLLKLYKSNYLNDQLYWINILIRSAEYGNIEIVQYIMHQLVDERTRNISNLRIEETKLWINKALISSATNVMLDMMLERVKYMNAIIVI